MEAYTGVSAIPTMAEVISVADIDAPTTTTF